MGSPPHLVLPDPSQQRSSLSFSPGSVYSPDSCAISCSLSSSDSSSSSFTHSLPLDGDPALYVFKEEKMQQQRKQKTVRELNVQHNNRAKSKQGTESSSIKSLRERKLASTSCTKEVSMRKSCCRCAGTFAADCAAVSCCPCAVLSLFAFFLIDVPSGLVRKLRIRLQTRLGIKDALSVRSGRGGDLSPSIFTSTWSYREATEGEGEKHAVSIFSFPPQNLIEHFEAENVGFGCLSQKRE